MRWTGGGSGAHPKCQHWWVLPWSLLCIINFVEPARLLQTTAEVSGAVATPRLSAVRSKDPPAHSEHAGVSYYVDALALSQQLRHSAGVLHITSCKTQTQSHKLCICCTLRLFPLTHLLLPCLALSGDGDYTCWFDILSQFWWDKLKIKERRPPGV